MRKREDWPTQSVNRVKKLRGKKPGPGQHPESVLENRQTPSDRFSVTNWNSVGAERRLPSPLCYELKG